MMLLINIVKQILTEGKASAFLKFYHEIEKGYNPHNAILFECLVILKTYYESYIKWYDKFPHKKKQDKEVYPHFVKRLQEINIAIDSDDIKRKIIAIDNGINQWHIDLPVIRHLQIGFRDGEDEVDDRIGDKNDEEWEEVMGLLIKLGKLSHNKPPYKRIYE